ncbi:MAG: hypothetical protein LQ342_006673 [Letrouitia transgressa]|nr:MAG: hypothetical protein LQ342_006673 [Letrouitia transgressa]
MAYVLADLGVVLAATVLLRTVNIQYDGAVMYEGKDDKLLGMCFSLHHYPGLAPTTTMNSSNMIFHVVYTAEDPVTTRPFAWYVWLMFSFMTVSVFAAGEATLGRLRAPFDATKQRFGVPPKMFAQITSPRKGCLRGATRVAAAPGPAVRKRVTKILEV